MNSICKTLLLCLFIICFQSLHASGKTDVSIKASRFQFSRTDTVDYHTFRLSFGYHPGIDPETPAIRSIFLNYHGVFQNNDISVFFSYFKEGDQHYMGFGDAQLTDKGNILWAAGFRSYFSSRYFGMNLGLIFVDFLERHSHANEHLRVILPAVGIQVGAAGKFYISVDLIDEELPGIFSLQLNYVADSGRLRFFAGISDGFSSFTWLKLGANAEIGNHLIGRIVYDFEQTSSTSGGLIGFGYRF